MKRAECGYERTGCSCETICEPTCSADVLASHRESAA